MSGTIVEINLAAAEGAPMESYQHVQLEAGKGIAGDRYFDFDADSHITLVDADEIDRINLETGWQLTPGDTRRNIVTRGVNLNQWETGRFKLGEAVLEGVELCEPCANLGGLLQNDDRTVADIVKVLAHAAGLRARVIEGGRIGVGDKVGE